MSSSSMKRLSQVKVAQSKTGADQEGGKKVAKLKLWQIGQTFQSYIYIYIYTAAYIKMSKYS